MKRLFTLLLFAAPLWANDPTQFYRDAIQTVGVTQGQLMVHFAGIGDQGVNDQTLLNALLKLESVGNRLTYGVALLSGQVPINDHNLPLLTCGGFSSTTDVIRFNLCNLEVAQTELGAAIQYLQPFTDGSIYFTRYVPWSQQYLAATIADARNLTYPLSGQLVRGSNAQKAMYGLRGSYGYLDYSINFAFAHLQSTIGNATDWNRVLPAINRGAIILYYTNLSMQSCFGLATPDYGKDLVIGDNNAPFQFYVMRLDTDPWYPYLATLQDNNMSAFNRAYEDAWRRLDSAGYWLSEGL